MNTTLFGIMLKLLAVLIGIGVVIAVKYLPSEMPNTQMIFFRCFFAIPILVVYTLIHNKGDWQKAYAEMRPHNLHLHARRSTFGLVSMFLIFTSVKFAPLPVVNALKELAPILITLLAAIFLGEKFKLIRTIGLLFGVLGVAVISYEAIFGGMSVAFGETAAIGALCALLAAFTIAIAQIQIRSMVGRESPASIVFFFFIAGCAITIPFAPFTWQMPASNDWMWLIIMGLSGGMTQVLLTTAYKFADASTIAPFEYLSIPLTILVGGMLFDEWPNIIAFSGIALILIGGLIIIMRERQLAIAERHARRVKST